MTENIDFSARNPFLALLSYNNVIKEYEERFLGQIFTPIPNPHSVDKRSKTGPLVEINFFGQKTMNNHQKPAENVF